MVSSSTGTLKVTGAKNGYYWAVLNGFQSVQGPVTVASSPTMTVVTPPPAVITATTSLVSAPIAVETSKPFLTSTLASPATLTPLIWGVCGHPSWSNYASWVPANVTTQMNDLNTVGASYYRISFESVNYPSYLDTLEPKAKTAGITLLPILPISLVAANSAQVNYSKNYTIGYNWATYAISKGYAIPTWELGNEVENDDLVDVVYDGTHATDFPRPRRGWLRGHCQRLQRRLPRHQGRLRRRALPPGRPRSRRKC